MKIRVNILLIVLCVAVLFGACNKSNNILLGRVEEKVGSHIVIVTDCYKTSIPPAQLLAFCVTFSASRTGRTAIL